MENLKNRASPGLEKGKHTVGTEKKGKQVVVNNNARGGAQKEICMEVESKRRRERRHRRKGQK